MPFDFTSCLEKARQLQKEGASDEDLLRFVRLEEASMMDSVKLMRQLKGIPLREAQDIIHFSETWADHRESHEQLQKTFAEAFRQLARETESGEK